MSGGLRVAAKLTVNVAEFAQRAGFSVPVAGLAEQSQGLLLADGGLRVPAQPPIDHAQVAQRAGFSVLVAGLAEQSQGLLLAIGGLPIAAQPPVDGAEIGQCGRFGGAVAGLAGSATSEAVDDEGLRVMAADVKVAIQSGGQAGGVGRPAVSSGVLGDCDQGGQLGIQPGSCSDGAGDRRDGGAGRRDTGPAVAFCGVEGVDRGGGGCQVVVEQAGQRRPEFRFGALSAGLFGGVAAEQVVHAVPAGLGGVDQVGAGQPVKQLPSGSFGGAG